MDIQTQKYVKEIGENLDALSGKPITSGQVLDLEEHVSFLLELVHKQEKEIDDSNELTLQKLLVDSSGINMSLKGNNGLYFMATLIKFFEDNGGKNFFTFTALKDEYSFEVTIKNLNGELSASQKIEQLQTQLSKYERIVELAKEWHEAFNEEYGDRCIPMHPTVQNLHDVIKALKVK